MNITTIVILYLLFNLVCMFILEHNNIWDESNKPSNIEFLTVFGVYMSGLWIPFFVTAVLLEIAWKLALLTIIWSSNDESNTRVDCELESTTSTEVQEVSETPRD